MVCLFLSSGACLVDLPGVRDANAARAKVAASYLRNCNLIWIVAPIKRAGKTTTVACCCLLLLVVACCCLLWVVVGCCCCLLLHFVAVAVAVVVVVVDVAIAFFGVAINNTNNVNYLSPVPSVPFHSGRWHG